MTGLAPVNALIVRGREVLLVEVGGGAQVHLADRAQGGTEGRAAVQPWRLDPDRPGYQTSVDRYEPTALTDPSWEPTTLCGKIWNLMAAGEAGPLVSTRVPVSAPSCRSCLRLLDRSFPKAPELPGIEVLASVVADEVVEWGSAVVRGTPAQHVDTTRSAIRRALKKRGFRSSTFVVETVIHVISDDATEAVPEATRRAWTNQAIANMDIAAGGGTVTPLRPDGIDWRTWVTDDS